MVTGTRQPEVADDARAGEREQGAVRSPGTAALGLGAGQYAVLALQRSVGNQAAAAAVRALQRAAVKRDTTRTLARCAGDCRCGGRCREEDVMFDEARGRLLRAVAGQEPHRRPAAPGSRVVLATVPIGGRLQRQPEDVEADAQWGVMETAAGYAGVSRVHDHSDLRPTVDVDEKEARLLVRRAIEQLGPLGAKVSPFPGDTAVASVPSSSGPTQEYGAPKTIPCECASSRWRKLDQDAFRQNQRRLPFNLHARIGL